MLFWIIIIVFLNGGLLLSLYRGFHQNITLLLSYLILLTALGILYRIFQKTKAGEFEKLKHELNELEQQNTSLKAQLPKTINNQE